MLIYLSVLVDLPVEGHFHPSKTHVSSFFLFFVFVAGNKQRGMTERCARQKHVCIYIGIIISVLAAANLFRSVVVVASSLSSASIGETI